MTLLFTLYEVREEDPSPTLGGCLYRALQVETIPWAGCKFREWKRFGTQIA